MNLRLPAGGYRLEWTHAYRRTQYPAEDALLRGSGSEASAQHGETLHQPPRINFRINPPAFCGVPELGPDYRRRDAPATVPRMRVQRAVRAQGFPSGNRIPDCRTGCCVIDRPVWYTCGQMGICRIGRRRTNRRDDFFVRW